MSGVTAAVILKELNVMVGTTTLSAVLEINSRFKLPKSEPLDVFLSGLEQVGSFRRHKFRASCISAGFVVSTGN